MFTRKRIWFSAFLLCSAACFAQTDTVILLAKQRWDSTYDLEKYTRYYINEGNKEEPGSIVGQEFFQDSNFSKTIRNKYGRKPVVAWSRWIIHNPLPHEEQALLLF